eukprot:1663040-Pleurochrysis_carterae.AAC.1
MSCACARVVEGLMQMACMGRQIAFRRTLPKCAEPKASAHAAVFFGARGVALAWLLNSYSQALVQKGKLRHTCLKVTRGSWIRRGRTLACA